MQWTKAFLTLLNTKNPTAAQWRDFLTAAQRDNRFHRSGIENAHEMLCEAVGAWIESGFQPDGSEKPRDRTYLNWGNQLIFQRMEELLDCFLTCPGEGLFGLQANPHKSQDHPLYGQLAVHIEPSGGFRLSPVLFNATLPAEQLAALAFFIFWGSPLLYTLMRCAKCRTYSIARPREKPYVWGWHCKPHQKSALAMASMKEARRAARREWFGLAVEAYRVYKGHQRRTTSDMVLFITEWVRDRGASITRNTITRNLDAIKAGKDPKAIKAGIDPQAVRHPANFWE